MSYGGDSYQMTGGFAGSDPFAVDAAREERASFIRNTYAHLLTAVLIFCGLLGVLLNVDPVRDAINGLLMRAWWLSLIGFMGASWIAQKWATSESSSTGKQYLGLGLYVVAEAVIFVPLLTYASMVGDNIILTSGVITALVFGGLTATVMASGADFSFMRGALSIGGMAALGLIGVSFLFPINLGTWFSVGMIVLASGYILTQTSDILRHYRTHQHVAASLALFSSVATLFFYVVRLMTALSDD